MRYNLVWNSLGLINHDLIYEKYKYVSFTTNFNDTSILLMIMSWDYLNLSLVSEYVGEVTIPTQVIKYNQYSHQLKLYHQ